MTFQFSSNVSVPVLCALCIAIAQVMRRALSMSPPMPMYLTVRVVYIAQVAIDRFDPPPPLSSACVCVVCAFGLDSLPASPSPPSCV